jgi:hypothetical protein
VFKAGDEKACFLSGAIEIPPTGDRGKWSGTINLPGVKIPIKPQ